MKLKFLNSLIGGYKHLCCHSLKDVLNGMQCCEDCSKSDIMITYGKLSQYILIRIIL